MSQEDWEKFNDYPRGAQVEQAHDAEHRQCGDRHDNHDRTPVVHLVRGPHADQDDDASQPEDTGSEPETGRVIA